MSTPALMPPASVGGPFDDLANLAAQVGFIPVVVVALLDGDEIHIDGQFGLAAVERSVAIDWCRHTLGQRTWVELRDDPRGKSVGLRWFAGIPLTNSDGDVVGVLGALDRTPRKLTPRQRAGLQTVGHEVVIHLDLRLHARNLTRAKEERRRTEVALRDSETFFEALVESLPQNIFRKDLSGRFTFVNRRFCQTVGRSRSEVIGLTDYDLFPRELAAKYQRDDEKVLTTGEPFETTEVNVTPDGTTHWFHVIKTSLSDSTGQPIGLQGIFWDVTTEHRAQADLAHERDLLRSLLDSAPDAIYFKDRESKIIRASRALAIKLGLKDARELEGKTDHDFFSREHADLALADERRVLETGKPLLGYTEKETWPDGRVSWALTSKLPLFDEKKAVIGTFGISKDITDLKAAQERLEQAEANYRGIVENAVEGIFQTTPDGHYRSANLALAKIYGFDSTTELIQKRTDIAHELYVNPNRRHEFAQALQRSDKLDKFESEVYRKDGTVIWISENARAVRDQYNRLMYYEGTVEDVTARKRAEEELSRANAELAAARDAALASAHAKSQFLANTSHEIRTPMNAVIGMTRLLLDTPMTSEQRDYAETVRDAAQSLLNIINDILDFSKLESGKVNFLSRDFDLRETLEDTAELLAERAYSRQLEFSVWIDHAIPQIVKGDADRLRQVLTNLLGNAIKFTLKGEVTLKARVLSTSAGQIVVRFEVHDTGIGIRPEAQSKIFEAFEQADGSTTRKFGGTGLGLAISRQLVERMAGDIGLDSAEGQGSTFWFTATFGLAEQPVAAKGLAQGSVVEALDPLLPRLLVVDDHASTREAIRHQLERLPVRADFASSAAEALDVLRSSGNSGGMFMAALVDLQLADMDGLTFAHEAHSLPGLDKLGIVLLAPLGQRLDPGLLRTVGVAGHLVKPVKQARLAEVVARLIRGEDLLSESETRTFRREGTKSVTAGNKSLRILLAEDNVVNQRVAQALLKKMGYALTGIASNGREVMEAIARNTVDVILMDCQMPEMDGYETTLSIRRAEADGDYGPRPQHYVIALTANAMAGDRERCLAAGMDDFLTKPLEEPALISALALAVRRIEGTDDPAPGAADAPPAQVSAPIKPATDSLPVLREESLSPYRVPDDPSVLGELVGLILRDLPVRLAAIEAAMTGRESAALKDAAHTLKGSASNLGGLRLAATCSAIEESARESRWDAMEALRQRVRQDAADFEAALQPFRG